MIYLIMWAVVCRFPILSVMEDTPMENARSPRCTAYGSFSEDSDLFLIQYHLQLTFIN